MSVSMNGYALRDGIDQVEEGLIVCNYQAEEGLIPYILQSG
jgi:hypothetical protein